MLWSFNFTTQVLSMTACCKTVGSAVGECSMIWADLKTGCGNMEIIPKKNCVKALKMQNSIIR